ncbi:MAG TPA: WYL domain-containing protein [Acidimicrobiales bacterium]|nr:WYL domain-containing protein [Acidimicrobiales bacterium]
MDRVERLTNLLLVLLDTERPLTLQQVIHTVEGYPPGRDAYRQAFERDKRLLREQGIVITVETVDGEAGYRIRPEDYYLPDLGLSEEEQSALNLAVAGVRIDGRSAEEAVWKLGAVPTAATVLADLPSLPALPALHEAMRSHRTVSFEHRGQRRTLDPYGLLFRFGSWYVVGMDHDRAALRSFRVDRITGAPTPVEGATFAPPGDFDPSTAMPEDPWRIGEGEGVAARVLVDAFHANLVAAELGAEAVVERRPDGSAVFELTVVNPGAFRTWVLGLLDHAVVLAPEDLRRAVVDWLEPLAAR